MLRAAGRGDAARASAALTRPGVLSALAGVVAVVVGLQLLVAPESPPGFIRDEASFALNAHTLSRDLRDQDGARLPLFFRSFGDYKPPVFPYALAGVFRVTGPDERVARGLATFAVLAAVLMVGLLAWRRTGSPGVVAVVLLLAGTVPWLFELGRVALDTALTPLAVVAILVVVEWASRSPAPSWARGTAVGVALGLFAYTYASARVLAPLYAAALLVFVRPGRWAWLAWSWGVFALALIPMAVYAERHPGALTARYEATKFAHEGMSAPRVAFEAIGNYVRDANVWEWVTAGDPTPYIHTWGAGQLYAALVALAAIGVAGVVRRRPRDSWWLYVVAVLLLTPIPAALTEDRLHSPRLAPVPVVLAVLAIPGAAYLLEGARNAWWARGVVVVLAGVTILQFADFLDVYMSRGASSRAGLFEARVPSLLERAFAGSARVYVDYDDRYAMTHAQWYAVSRGIPVERVVRLSDGGVPPVGSTVFGRFQECDYACEHLAEGDTYWVARAIGP